MINGDAQAAAVKRVIAWLLRQLMKRQALTKVELARRMHTSRAALDRLLDADTLRSRCTPCTAPRKPWAVN